MSEKMIKTLEQRLKEVGYREGYFRKQILNTVKEWLQQKHKYYMTSPLASIKGRAFLALDKLLEELK